MKRIIGAIVILAVIFGTSIGIKHKLNDNIEKMTAVAAEGRDYAKKYGRIDPRLTEKIVGTWDGMSIFMAAFLPHGELDGIEIGFMNIPDYEDQELTDEYLESLNECINRLEHIKESEKVTFKNIF